MSSVRNIRLHLEYDGTDYVGWQRQENGRSIQGELERVLGQILGGHVDVIGAGRTDAGVHARGQVANFRTTSDISPDAVKGGLNGLLPDDIVILAAMEVPLEFHARFSARARRYSYRISTVPEALMRRYSWHLRYDLDLALMLQVAQAVLGRHEFTSFCKTASEADHHWCTVTASSWSADGAALIYSITADRFLHGMVRALVGTMVDIGRGYTPADRFVPILEKQERSAAGMAAPARGLVLEEVVY